MSEMPLIEPMICPGPIEQRFRERLYHFVFRSWSYRVVEERLAEVDRCERLTRLKLDKWIREEQAASGDIR